MGNIDKTEVVMNEGPSQEVLEHFNLFRDPFAHTESADEVFRSHDLKAAEDAVVECAEKHRFTALIGDTGSGKTTARDSALDRVRRTGKVTVVIPEPLLTPRLNVQQILTTPLLELGERVPSDLVFKSRHARRALEAIQGRKENVLLVIEEAHMLHPSALRSLKHMYEKQAGFIKLLGILLVGHSITRRLSGWKPPFQNSPPGARCSGRGGDYPTVGGPHDREGLSRRRKGGVQNAPMRVTLRA